MSRDPSQYLKFAGERLRPALDLLSRIPAAAPETVIDLGCGAGNLAPLFLQRWPNVELLGVDGSPEMLAKACTDHPDASFERGAFEADYRARVGRIYKPEADGRTLFPFRRLFIVAQRAA